MLLEERQQPDTVLAEPDQNNQSNSLVLNDIYSFSTKEEDITYNLLPPAPDNNMEVITNLTV